MLVNIHIQWGQWASVQWQCIRLLVNRLTNRSCTRGMIMIHNKIQLISLGYPRPSKALQCRIVA